jgi:hypothetical protein
MAESITPEYLLKGAVYALEQCGMLLRDAALPYRNSAYVSAVVLAAVPKGAVRTKGEKAPRLFIS